MCSAIARVTLLVLLLVELGKTVALAEVPTTMGNANRLDEAQARIGEFEVTLEPERLREADVALQNVVLAQESDVLTRHRLRTRGLQLWLRLVATIDHFVDPNFNADDVPEDLVQPPPTSGGIVHPPGADPALIPDPQSRRMYEMAVKANRRKIETYGLQLQLSRLNERIQSQVEAFIRSAYGPIPADQEELRSNISILKNVRRQQSLLKLLEH